jgi:hypothetical protein
LAIQPGPQQLRTISEALWRSQASQPTRKGVLRIFVQVPIAATIFRSTSAETITATIIDGAKSSGCCEDGLHGRPAARLCALEVP